MHSTSVKLILGVSGVTIRIPQVKLTFQELTASVRVLFNSGAEVDANPGDIIYQFLGQPLHLYKNISIPAGSYRFDDHFISYTSAGNRRMTYTGSSNGGTTTRER